jgi:8-oxo-dGTP diphosphatase
MITEYVCGFAFSEDLGRVVLIQKKRPDWQTGRFNGVGGHVEPGESFEQAMAREFEEETGVMSAPHSWEQFAAFRSGAACVLFFKVRNDKIVAKVKTMTDEFVVTPFTDCIFDRGYAPHLLPNIATLIGHAVGGYFHPGLPILNLPA